MRAVDFVGCLSFQVARVWKGFKAGGVFIGTDKETKEEETCDYFFSHHELLFSIRVFQV
jgi:hypothetical protein